MFNKLKNKLLIFSHNLKYGFKSIFWKKDKTCVLFDSWFGVKFADNPRYLYQYLSENRRQLGLSHVVWVTHSEQVLNTLHEMNYEAYLIDSKESVHYHKISKYHFVNNAPIGKGKLTGELLADYSYRSKRINLWHGTGVIKNVGFASNDYKKKTQKFASLYKFKNELYKRSYVLKKFITELGPWADNYFLTTSLTEKEKIKEFFCLSDKRIITSGYPRDSYSCRYTPYEEEIVNQIKEYSTVILYLPTFRTVSDKFSMNELSDAIAPKIKDSNILFIQKAHSAANDQTKFSFKNNVLNLNPDFDINVITPLTSIVITDYSSILADAMYFRKPVILYAPDYEEYVNDDRGLATDAEYILSASYRFGDKYELINYVMENYKTPEKMKKVNYDEVRKRIWGNQDKDISIIWKDILEQTR